MKHPSSRASRGNPVIRLQLCVLFSLFLFFSFPLMMDHILEFAFGAMDEACISGQQNRRTNAIHMRGVQQGVFDQVSISAVFCFITFFFPFGSLLPSLPGVNIFVGFPLHDYGFCSFWALPSGSKTIHCTQQEPCITPSHDHFWPRVASLGVFLGHLKSLRDEDLGSTDEGWTKRHENEAFSSCATNTRDSILAGSL